jgi:nucleoside phosphorylase/DNA-binding NarL/FixJ family response regulator
MKIKVIVVEDNRDKLAKILRMLRENVATLIEEPFIARDAKEAKAALRDASFDLMLLDLSIPRDPEGAPLTGGGVELLKEIRERDLYSVPKEVVGLTAYEDLRDEAKDAFAEDLWAIIHYDASSDSWSDQIVRKIRHIAASQKLKSAASHGASLCIVTALYEPELEAVLKLPWSWKEINIDSDVANYFEGNIVTPRGSHRVIASAASRMGMPAAGVLASKMLMHFRPQFLAMVGISAGIHGRCNLGDVVAADPAWDWGSGKFVLKDGQSAFEAAPHQLGLHSAVRTKLEKLSRETTFFDTLRQEGPGPKPDTTLKLRIGPSASGATVLADASRLPLIETQNRKLLAVEMETYAVYAAAWEGLLPQSMALSLKSVCDFADHHKADDYQHFAAYTSAQTLRHFAESYLF